MLTEQTKILVIGNYPPPMCGWAIQTQLAVQELRRRGHACEVLKINDNRHIPDAAYIDVQSPWDYAWKVILHCRRGFAVNAHVNGMSAKGYVAALGALAAARIMNRPALLTFHGGLSQNYFPRRNPWWIFQAYRVLFQLASAIACDSEEIRRAILTYGIRGDKVTAIEAFSEQYTAFTPVTLDPDVETFLATHKQVFLCYVSFRPEYRLEVLQRCMREYRRKYPDAGFIWVGFPSKEFASATECVASWPASQRTAVLLLPNLQHDEFLTLMTRCLACVRTPACDGVAASVLEALALGVPVIASENGRRPGSVTTYADGDVNDMCAKLVYVTEHYEEIRTAIPPPSSDDNVGRMADWLVRDCTRNSGSQVANAR